MTTSDQLAMATSPNFGPGKDSWECLSIETPILTGRGNKSAGIQFEDGAGPVLWRLPGMVPAFEPSSFGGEADAVRQTVNFRVPPEHVELFEGLEEWLIGYCSSHSLRLFGKEMTGDQVLAMFSSPMKRHEKYGVTLRCKLVLAGEYSTRFWTPEGAHRGCPETWKACHIRSVAKIVGLWWVGREFGVTLQLTDCQVTETAVVQCPF